MPTYLHPGVYIEEIPSGSRPIEGVATSVTAFVGPARRGPVAEANLIQKLDDYITEYGEIDSEDDAMGFAVQAFYLNGGKAAYICRLVGEGTTPASADFAGQDGGANNLLQISAGSAGVWGNEVYARIVKPDSDSLTFTLEVGHIEDTRFKVDETFPNLSMRENADNYALSVVNEDSLLVDLEVNANAPFQGATVRGGLIDVNVVDYFSSAAAAASGLWTLTLNLNGLGSQQISIDPSSVTLAGADHNVDGTALAAAVQNAVRALGASSPHTDFGCAYSANRFELTLPQSASNAKIEVSAGSLLTLLRLDGDSVAQLAGATLGTGATLFSSNATGFPSFTTPAQRTLTLDIDNHGSISLILPPDAITPVGDNAADGAALARAVQDVVRDYNPQIGAYKNFTCTYTRPPATGAPQFILRSGSSTPRSSGLTAGGSDLEVLMGINTGNAGLAEAQGREFDQGSAPVVPAQSSETQLAGAVEFPPSANDYADFYNETLRKVRDVSIVVNPGEHWAEDGSGNAVISQTLAFAETYRRMMVIIDPPQDLELDQAATVDAMGLPTSTYSVLYYPWVQMANPLFNADTNPTAPRYVSVAPSSFAAGMWAKIDGKRGVWKAPAGVETQLLGASGLEVNVEDGEQDQLNPLGVNCIRRIPSFGTVFWGSRTLATRADPEWRYVPVRRTAIFIEQSIYNGIQWAVFEPNDHPLWSSLRNNIGAFMNGLFRAGAFQGATSNDAYFVRCGLGDTMTQADIDRGQVIVIVGFAPLKPAEFVIVRIQQKVGEQ